MNSARNKAVLLAAIVLALSFITQIQNGNNTRSAEKLNVRQVKATSLTSRTPLAMSGPIYSIPQPPPTLNVRAALVKNLASNFYFLKLNAKRNWPMASLTKLLTAVVALEKLRPPLKIGNLIKLMMLVSNNDAAEKLAELYGKKKFLEEMRLKAKELNMSQTSIFDVTGLSFLNQSTPEDLEKLVSYIIKKHPSIFQLSRKTEAIINGKNIANINRFAGQRNFMGGKTGYTDEAGGNLISVFQYKGQPILILVLGAKNKDERFNQTKILFEWISKFYK